MFPPRHGDTILTVQETIRRVLSDCVKFLVDMKANIAKLVAFFQKVKVIISAANTSHIQMLLNNSKLAMTSLDNGALLDYLTKRVSLSNKPPVSHANKIGYLRILLGQHLFIRLLPGYRWYLSQGRF